MSQYHSMHIYNRYDLYVCTVDMAYSRSLCCVHDLSRCVLQQFVGWWCNECNLWVSISLLQKECRFLKNGGQKKVCIKMSTTWLTLRYFMSIHVYHYLCRGHTCFFLEAGEDLYLALVDLFTLGASWKEKHPKSIGASGFIAVWPLSCLLSWTCGILLSGSYFHYPSPV